MKIGKDTQTMARRLFRLCLDGDTLVEDNVRHIASQIVARKPRNYVALLNAFYEQVRYAVQRRTVTIESAVTLTDDERRAIYEKLSSKHGENLYYHWLVNPELIGGIRIQIGDDVRDGSVKARIDRLSDIVRNLSK
ncbi:MAG: F0F1 ATP synthase subunit delta [Akkermansia sp.]|nr:F0F1 ATP synthase subunit delta [Akkermansia sp.]